MDSSFISTLLEFLRSAATGRSVTSTTTEVISSIISNYVTEKFGEPRPSGTEKIAIAKRHMEKAGEILDEIRGDLASEAKKLEELSATVELKRLDVVRYDALAATNKETINAIRQELEIAIQAKLEEQARKGRRMRQAVAAFMWIITLIAGAALGTYFPRIVAAIN
jgi:hypothetical protein